MRDCHDRDRDRVSIFGDLEMRLRSRVGRVTGWNWNCGFVVLMGRGCVLLLRNWFPFDCRGSSGEVTEKFDRGFGLGIKRVVQARIRIIVCLDYFDLLSASFDPHHY